MVERAIAGQNGVTMETNVFVKDADGDLREHDIILTHTQGLRVTKTAIECKDRGRKIGKPDLDAFRSKCADTGIHKGVIVSSSGFAQSALRASRRTAIQCLELSKAKRFPWIGMSASVMTQRDYSNIGVKVFAPTPIKPPFKIFGPDGAELSVYDYQNAAQAAFNDHPGLAHLGRDEPTTITINWKPEGGVYVIDADDVRHEVDYLILHPTFTVTETTQPFEHHSYSGDTGTYEIAISDFKAGGLDAKLVMIRDADNIRFMIQPNVPDGTLIELESDDTED